MFTQAIQRLHTDEKTTTENGAVTFARTGDAVLDFFYQAAASRQQDTVNLIRFEKAYIENQDLAIRCLLWLRDIRGGAGERATSRSILKYLGIHYPDVALKIVNKIPELGRWDDLFEFVGTPVESTALSLVLKALEDKNGLCAKWTPRQGPIANKLRSLTKLSPKQWRKRLVALTKVVETQMCENKWDEINYSHVPSRASSIYRTAFFKHDEERYTTFNTKAVAGEVKVNASAIFPHDVLPTQITYGYIASKTIEDAALAQWNALPNYIGENSILPMIDVSGSMESIIPGSTTTAMHVAISLGLYCADKCRGAFHGAYLNFSTDPVISVMKGNVIQECKVMNRRNWGGSTDIQKAFKAILDMAITYKVSQEDMPKSVLILSDMEFNSASPNTTNFEAIRNQYLNAGYELPRVIFWNLMSRNGHAPAQKDTQNVSLVAGFSPAVIKNTLQKGSSTPYDNMVDILMNKRYSWLD